MTVPARIIVVSWLVAGLAGSCPAAAGDPIRNNDYRLDLTRTVASGSTRKIGMGGAFVGFAEGNAAIPDNPAAAAYRARAFLRKWEFDAVLGTLAVTNDDADNSGSTSLVYGSQALVDAGLMAQYKDFGIGGVARMSVFQSDNLPKNQEAQFAGGVIAMGYTLFERQLALGLSANPVGARVHPQDERDPLSFKLKGTSWGGGVLWHPWRGRWRFGAAYTSAVSTDEGLPVSSAPITSGDLIVPRGVLVSDLLALGTAYEWDDFPLWRGRAALTTFDVRVFGSSPADANGTTAFVTQTYQPVGQKTIVSEHLGLEVEAIPKVLRLRLGTYHEPSRYEGISARQHVTGGFELRLTRRNVWDNRPLAISYAIDGASRYLVHSVSIWLYTFTIPVAAAP